MTEELIKAAWSSYKSVERIAKDFGVKPAEVRETFDIALARQPKTSDTELAARREHQRNIVRKSVEKNPERHKQIQHEYYQKHKEAIKARQKKWYKTKKELKGNE